jgi:hypothetical protein
MADGDGAHASRDAKRYAALPPRIPLEDLVEETDASTPADEPTNDPNRDVANRWGFGMVGT